MAEQMNIDIIATDRATPTLRRTRNEIDKVGQQARNTADQTRNLTRSLGGVGRGAGQAGIQVQQFVGQIQGGVNPMVALSQQSADLGFVLGVPLLGAVVSIAAALGTVLLPRLFEAEKGFADLRKEIKSVGLDINDMPAELLAANMKLLEFNAKDAKDEFNDLSTQLQEAEKDLVRIAQESQLNPFGGDFAAETENAQQNVDDLRKQVLQSNVAMLVAAERAKNFAAELKGASGEIKTFTYETDRFIRNTRKSLMNLPPIVFDTDPITSDISNIWQEADKTTTSFHQLGKEVKMTAMTMDNVGERALTNVEDGLVDLISGTKSAADAFKSMARSIISDLIRMSIQQRITAPLFNAMFGQTPTTYTTVQGSANPTAGAPIADFEGGGYTGIGGRSGGVDGRGGFPAILHPNETVIDHTKGQGMGSGVTVNLNISTGVSQTVRAEIANLLPQITQAAKAAVADARMRGGSFSKSMVGS